MYLDELAGPFWPRRDNSARSLINAEARELTVLERFDALNIWPEYSIITNFVEFENHHQDLKQFLNESCSEKPAMNATLFIMPVKGS